VADHVVGSVFQNSLHVIIGQACVLPAHIPGESMGPLNKMNQNVLLHVLFILLCVWLMFARHHVHACFFIVAPMFAYSVELFVYVFVISVPVSAWGCFIFAYGFPPWAYIVFVHTVSVKHCNL